MNNMIRVHHLNNSRSQGVAYAYLGDLPAYQGTLQQSLLMNEIVLSLGFTSDGASGASK